jgi:hypothetical protein
VAEWLAGNVQPQIAALAEHHLDCLLVATSRLWASSRRTHLL